LIILCRGVVQPRNSAGKLYNHGFKSHQCLSKTTCSSCSFFYLK
jgi:hypothetical protein